MTCQMCQSAEATVHVTERGPSGSFDDHHYCKMCCSVVVLPKDLPKLDPMPSREQLTQALIEAGVLVGRPLTRAQASETVTAFLKAIEAEPSGPSAD